MKIKLLVATTFILLSFAIKVEAQEVPCTGDSILLKAPASSGTIQWQESYDSYNWNDIAGATGTSYSIGANVENYYRAKTTEGTKVCYSQAQWVNTRKVVSKPIAGDDRVIFGYSSNLEAFPPAEGTGTWSILYGKGGTIADNTNPNSKISGYYDSTYILEWTVSNDECTNSDFVKYTFKKPGTTSITQQSTDVLQYEVVFISAQSLNMPMLAYAGTIGDSSVIIYKMNDTTLSFYMPPLAAGTYNMTADIEGQKKTFVYNVKALGTIANPTQYLTDFLSDVVIPSGPEYKYLQDSLNHLLALFNSYSPAQKQVVVAYIKANRSFIDSMSNHLDQLALHRSNYQECVNETLIIKKLICNISNFSTKTFYNEKNLQTLFPYASLIVKQTQKQLISGVLKLNPVTALIGTAALFIGMDLINHVTNEYMSFLRNYVIDKTFEPIAFDLNKPASGSEYKLKKANSIQATLTFKNLAIKSYPVPVLNSLLRTMFEVKALYDLYMPNNDYFVTLPNLTNKRNADTLSFLKLVIASNPKVTGALSGTADNLKVTFDMNETLDQNFSYYIAYNDGYFKFNSPTISAKLKAKDTLYITPSRQVVHAPDGKVYFSITCTDDWTLTKMSPWIYPFQVMGSGNANIGVFYDTNNTKKVREGIIKVESPGMPTVYDTIEQDTFFIKPDKCKNFNPYLTYGSVQGGSPHYLTYKTVKVGNREWMAENWAEKGVFYNLDSLTNSCFGRMVSISWALLDSTKACPPGFRLPELSEWMTLIQSYSIDDLLEGGAVSWPHKHANSSGMSIKPSGYKNFNGNFYNMGSNAYFLTHEKYNVGPGSWGDGATGFKYLVIDEKGVRVLNSIWVETYVSIRCVKIP